MRVWWGAYSSAASSAETSSSLGKQERMPRIYCVAVVGKQASVRASTRLKRGRSELVCAGAQSRTCIRERGLVEA